MVVGDLIPNDDVSVAWAVYPFPNAIHYVLIDEDKGSPTVPLTGDAINGTGIGGEDNAVDDFRLSSLEDIDEATQAVVYVYCQYREDYAGAFDIDFYDGNAWRGYQNLIPTQEGPAWGWDSKTFAGLSMDQTDVNNARVRFRGDFPDIKDGATIGTCYVELTYTEVAVGYGHDFMGVPAANIGSVNGVPTANIASIKGV